MSTPTPNQSGTQPSPVSKKSAAQHNVSTPSNHQRHASPAPPRSIPSPVATRKEQAGKTPVNHPTNSSSQGSKTIGGGTPMVPNLSQQGSTASPSAFNLASFTPTGLGVDLGTPSQLAALAGTPAALGSSMVPTMSELGLTVSGGMKRNEDEERRGKMRRILKTIGRSKGRVGEEGIARVSRRAGFANDIDAEKLTAEERERRVGNRTISIAGNTIVIDVDLKEHVPKGVQVLFSTDMAGVGDQALRAGSVLLQDLTYGETSPVNRTLDRFAANLETLAKTDRLSSSSISCFDALSGLYTGLKRLYDQELQLAKKRLEDAGMQERRDEDIEVICKRSGRPALHERGRLGLSIEYWRDERHGTHNKATEDAMDLDDKTEVDKTVEEDGIYRLHIETERWPSELYSSIRVSNAWLPDPLELQQASDSPTIIPWQEPSQTFLVPASDSAETMAHGTSVQKLPDVRFIAKLDPPIIMPWQTAANIFTAVGATIPQAFQMPIYHTLLLGLPNPIVGTDSGDAITTVQSVLVPNGGDYVEVKHSCNLNVAKNDLGFKLEELPFSHPRQLVELLPTLRQWACTSSLLVRTFGRTNNSTVPPRSDNIGTNEVSLDELLDDGMQDTFSALPVEITLATAPVPTIALSFPLENFGLRTTDVQILPNGDLQIADDSIKVINAVRALDVCNDLGVWIEWVKARTAQS